MGSFFLFITFANIFHLVLWQTWRNCIWILLWRKRKWNSVIRFAARVKRWVSPSLATVIRVGDSLLLLMSLSKISCSTTTGLLVLWEVRVADLWKVETIWSVMNEEWRVNQGFKGFKRILENWNLKPARSAPKKLRVKNNKGHCEGHEKKREDRDLDDLLDMGFGCGLLPFGGWCCRAC